MREVRTIARCEERPWPPDPADYAYTAGLSPFGWAWEFLRRNADYRRAAAAARVGAGASGRAVLRCPREDGTLWLVVLRSEPAAAPWGLEHFPEHDANGVDAPVFWRSDAIGGDLEAVLQLDGGGGADLLRLSDIPGRKAVLVRPGERARLLVENAGYAEVLSAAVPAHPPPDDVALMLGVGGWSSLDARLARLAAFVAFCKQRQDTLAGAGAPYRRSARRLADALVALDGWLAGRSYRDIAHAFHDPLEIEDDWRGPGAIKLRMRRRVAGGIALMQGGYRRLLTAGRRPRLR